MTRNQADDFYVGYLPTPATHRRLLVVLIPFLLLAFAALGGGIAASQRDPGDAVWESRPTSIEGTLRVDPYPFIDVQGETVLIVESGKIGTQMRVSDLAGRRVLATGFVLRRDGRRMLELLPGDDGLAVVPGDRAAPVQPRVSALPGVATLVGEIVDSKCYHGAMKPGDGKSHKACAILCIQGGIPPVLITYDDSGASSATMLASPDGGPVADWVLPFVGEPVEVRGELVWRDGQRVLQIEESGVRRAR